MASHASKVLTDGQRTDGRTTREHNASVAYCWRRHEYFWTKEKRRLRNPFADHWDKAKHYANWGSWKREVRKRETEKS